MTSKRDHERDAELDKKIEALRRKNEALMKRYKVRTRAHSQSNYEESQGAFMIRNHSNESTFLLRVFVSF